MEYQEDIHFAGDWSGSEQQLLGQAVQEYERSSQDNSPLGDRDGPAPWVCLRVRIEDTPYYLGYRFGEDDILKATSAVALADKIETRTGEQVESQPDELPLGGIPAYRLRKVVDFIRSDLSRATTVKLLADQIGMSEYHFAREFKRSLGLTPKQYLTQCRIEEARRLLQTTGLKIQEVAQRVGFTSASHFAEVFRKQTGLRPREYRLRYGE
jgi:AraC-like DNA-binding protein